MPLGDPCNRGTDYTWWQANESSVPGQERKDEAFSLRGMSVKNTSVTQAGVHVLAVLLPVRGPLGLEVGVPSEARAVSSHNRG